MKCGICLCWQHGFMRARDIRAEVFVKDLETCAGHNITTPSWAQVAPAGASSSTTDQIETVDQQHDAMYQAAKVGYKQDAHVTVKEDTEGALWLINSIVDNKATLVAREDGIEKQVSMQALVANWRVHKGKVTQELPGWDLSAKRFAPRDSEAWLADAAKGACAIAMMSIAETNDSHTNSVLIMVNPQHVKVRAPIAKGKLKLAASSQRIEKVGPKGFQSSAIVLGNLGMVDGPVYQMLPHFVAPLKSDGSTNDKAWVCPFWACQQDDEAPTMRLVWETVGVGKFMVPVPVLTNSEDMRCNPCLHSTCVWA